jgi:hypothetical protein
MKIVELFLFMGKMARAGAGIFDKVEPEPHKNGSAPQHICIVNLTCRISVRIFFLNPIYGQKVVSYKQTISRITGILEFEVGKFAVDRIPVPVSHETMSSAF